MKYHCWITFLLLGFLLTRSSIIHAEDSRPNVLFIISDDLNNAQGCYGNTIIQTPHIDKLASRGARFEKSYCTFPLCGPSRNSLLTGLYPNSTGILQNAQIFRQSIPSQVSLPQAFRLSGYLAARVGKLYHYNVPNSIGTNGHDDPASWEIEINPAGVDRLEEQPKINTLTPNQFGGTLSWYASPQSDAKHTDSLNADEAIWVLERCAKQKDRPFFLSVGFFRPHTPYVSPQAYFDKYDRGNLPVVRNVAEDQADIPGPALASYKKEQDKLNNEMRQEILQAYYASISFMDAQVGRLVEALERLDLEQNTIIVFTSDHGYHNGEHGLWQKMSLFEESSRVPLIVVAPNVTKPNTVVATPVSHLDIYPTLTELAKVNKPESVQGQSLVPLLKDPSATGRGWALTQVTRGGKEKRFFGYSLRTARWRYTEWDEGKLGRELYDHEKDQNELTNLAKNQDYTQILEELSGQLKDAIKTTFPKDGKTPEVRQELWAPNLTNSEY